MAESAKKEAKHQKDIIFVARITLPNGRVIWARDYGLRAFPIRRPPNDR